MKIKYNEFGWLIVFERNQIMECSEGMWHNTLHVQTSGIQVNRG